MNKTFTTEKPFVKKNVNQKDEYSFEPSKEVITTILNYSRSLSIRESKAAGKIEFNLN